MRAMPVADALPLETEDATAAGAGGGISHSRIEPNLRRLRMYVAVAECGSTHRAAEKLHLTPSSLTKAVQALEREAGVTLFDRTNRGMTATRFGEVLADRARRALSYVELAERELCEAQHQPEGSVCQGFSARVTHRQLAALIGIAHHQTETGAAQSLSVSQPAITLALRDLERLVGAPLFQRTARAMIPTLCGEILVRRAKLAFAEIVAAATDMSSLLGQITGRLVVGALPMSGALLAPRAIGRLLNEHPELQVSVVDGTFLSLIQGVLCGDIDVIIGALDYPTPVYDIAKEYLFDDQLAIVVRKHHPLTTKKQLSLADLRDAQWVVPRGGTPARMYLDQVMNAAGMEPGAKPIESNSLLTVRALLLESDRLSIISRHQINIDESANLLAALPLDLDGTTVPIGVGTRADGMMSAGVKAFLRHLHQVGDDLAGSIA